MALVQLTDRIHVLRGLVNVYLLDSDDGLVLIDTGFPGSAKKILKAVRSLGKAPTDVRHIVLTHCHVDHVGSAAALKRETGATVWAHPIDTPMIEGGETIRLPMTPSPGLRNRILTKVLARGGHTAEATKVDRLLEDGESPCFASDMTALHVPGHCAGQIALLWRRDGGVLFTADSCINRGGLKLAVATEHPQLALKSLARLATLDFDKALVMHGPPILSGAAEQFRQTNFDTFKHSRKA